jgi:hypothetical protein
MSNFYFLQLKLYQIGTLRIRANKLLHEGSTLTSRSTHCRRSRCVMLPNRRNLCSHNRVLRLAAANHSLDCALEMSSGGAHWPWLYQICPKASSERFERLGPCRVTSRYLFLRISREASFGRNNEFSVILSRVLAESTLSNSAYRLNPCCANCVSRLRNL